jgi:hypothetical protein
VIAALPITGLYENADCQWTTSVDAVTTSTTPLPAKLALSVKSGDPKLGPAIREGLVAALGAAGVSEFVDNPVTWPRADVTIFEVAGRYTPFYAPLTLKTKVTLDKARKGGHQVDATIEVSGSCTGLVGREAWMASPRSHVVDAAATLLSAARAP